MGLEILQNVKNITVSITYFMNKQLKTKQKKNLNDCYSIIIYFILLVLRKFIKNAHNSQCYLLLPIYKHHHIVRCLSDNVSN